MDLPYAVRLGYYPWEQTIPRNELFEFLYETARQRAVYIQAMFHQGVYTDNNLAVAVTNPQAAAWDRREDMVLATFTFGHETRDLLTLAIANAIHHHERGRPAAYGFSINPMTSGDGDPIQGASVRHADSYAGTGGLSRTDATREAGHILAEFDWFVCSRLDRLHDETDHAWIGPHNLPDEAYAELAVPPGNGDNGAGAT